MSRDLLRLTCLIVVFGASLAGCAGAKLKAPEGDPLARPEMAFDAFPVDTRFDEVMYLSKEAASGGRSFGGGGCGCN